MAPSIRSPSFERCKRRQQQRKVVQLWLASVARPSPSRHRLEPTARSLRDVRPPLSPLPYQPNAYDIAMGEVDLTEDFDEEVMRTDAFPSPSTLIPALVHLSIRITTAWRFRSSSPTPSDASTASSRSSSLTLLA